MVMRSETLRRSRERTAASRRDGSWVGLAREMPMWEPPRKWIRLTSPMSRGVTWSISPCMIHSKPSRRPSTSTPSSRARMVAAPMTLLTPGAGPPPTRIARVLRSVTAASRARAAWLTRPQLLQRALYIHPRHVLAPGEFEVGVVHRLRRVVRGVRCRRDRFVLEPRAHERRRGLGDLLRPARDPAQDDACVGHLGAVPPDPSRDAQHRKVERSAAP